MNLQQLSFLIHYSTLLLHHLLGINSINPKNIKCYLDAPLFLLQENISWGNILSAPWGSLLTLGKKFPNSHAHCETLSLKFVGTLGKCQTGKNV